MRIFKTLFLLVACITFFGSCKKLGCTNENSVSYDESAKKDDGSCVYNSDLKIYFNQAQSNAFIGSGIFQLKYYLNSQLIGTVETTEYSTSVPNCIFNNSFSTVVSIGKIESKSYSLIVRDSAENFLYNKALLLKGNTCTVYQLNN